MTDISAIEQSIVNLDLVMSGGGRKRRKGRSVKGSRSKTHPGDLNYTTKRGDKDFHRRGHNVKLSRRPYTKKSRKRGRRRRTRGKSRRYNKIKMNPLLRAALPFRPRSRRRSRNRANGERVKYRVRASSKHAKDALSR